MYIEDDNDMDTKEKEEREAQPHSHGTPRKKQEQVAQKVEKMDKRVQARRKITQKVARGFLSLAGKTVSVHLEVT